VLLEPAQANRADQPFRVVTAAGSGFTADLERHLDVASHIPPRHERVGLGQVADGRVRLRDGSSPVFDLALAGPGQAGHQVEQRGLAAPAAAEQADEAALLHGEREVPQRDDVAVVLEEGLAQVEGLEHRAHACFSGGAARARVFSTAIT
jgi:hypothetical protein